MARGRRVEAAGLLPRPGGRGRGRGRVVEVDGLARGGGGGGGDGRGAGLGLGPGPQFAAKPAWHGHRGGWGPVGAGRAPGPERWAEGSGGERRERASGRGRRGVGADATTTL